MERVPVAALRIDDRSLDVKPASPPGRVFTRHLLGLQRQRRGLSGKSEEALPWRR
jgi:hypothetical protein